MSEQDNISRINNVYAAFGRGDVDYILNQLTDDVRWVTHFDAVVPRAGDYPGKQNVSRFFQAIAESVEVTAFIPSEYVAQADTVVSMGQFGCKVRATGKEVSRRPDL